MRGKLDLTDLGVRLVSLSVHPVLSELDDSSPICHRKKSEFFPGMSSIGVV